MKNELNVIIKEYNEAKTKFQKQAEKAMKAYFKDFFEENEKIKALKWTQYTPYYNDGDPCVFSVYDITFTNTDDADELANVSPYGDYGGETEGIFATSTYGLEKEVDKKTFQACKDIEKILCSDAMEDVMETAFGDHVEVTVTKTGIQVDEYDHD